MKKSMKSFKAINENKKATVKGGTIYGVPNWIGYFNAGGDGSYDEHVNTDGGNWGLSAGGCRYCPGNNVDKL